MNGRTGGLAGTDAPGATVLIVDDDSATRRLLGQLVGDLGFHALVASGGDDALAIIEA